MYKGKRILGIIPARSGSKGLKHKNIKDFKGKPLMAHTIEAALKTKIFDKLIVSTDSTDYAAIAEKYGAIADIRPERLAEDDSSTIDLINYILSNENNYDYFVLLQPTSPLRKEEHIFEAVGKIIQTKSKSLVSVCEAEHSPLLMGTLDESMSMNGFIKSKNNKRRQDLDKYFRINGSIYIMEVDEFYKIKNFYGEKSIAYVMDNMSSIDIDNEMDFEIAKVLYENSIRLSKG